MQEDTAVRYRSLEPLTNSALRMKPVLLRLTLVGNIVPGASAVERIAWIEAGMRGG